MSFLMRLISVAIKSILAVRVSVEAVIAGIRSAVDGEALAPSSASVCVPADIVLAGDLVGKMAADEGGGWGMLGLGQVERGFGGAIEAAGGSP